MSIVLYRRKNVQKHVFKKKQDNVDFKRAELALQRAVNRITVFKENKIIIRNTSLCLF